MRYYLRFISIVLITTLVISSCSSDGIKSNIELCDSEASMIKQKDSFPPDLNICTEITSNKHYQEISDPLPTDLNKVLVTDISQKQDFEYKIYELLTTSNAAWYFHNENASTSQIQEAANIFEYEIYPTLVSVFGEPWISKIRPNDKLRIIHAPLGRGIGGYFKNTDIYPKQIYPTSNEITAIYIHSDLAIGSDKYLSVLTHELQHAMHWNKDRTEETWFNEGLSEYSVNSLGYNPFNINSFNPEISLIHWSLSNQSQHYFSARLFFTYLTDQYLNSDSLLSGLVAESSDGIQAINDYFSEEGLDKSFEELFSEWSIHNLLNGYDETHSYSNLEGNTFDFAKQNSIGFDEVIERNINQYSSHYVDIALPKEEGNMSIEFDGAPKINTWFSPINSLQNTCLWGNRGDSINSTLTTRVDLSGTQSPKLNFHSAFNIEDSWDYLHVLVSEDNGDTWTALSSPEMTPSPYSMSHLNQGYTGIQGWSDLNVSLDQYKSKTILVRLSYVTDASTTGPGICISDAVIKDINKEDTIQWDNNGFTVINNRVKQDFIVNVILMGNEHKIIPFKLDDNNNGVLSLPIPEYGSWYVVSVSAMNKISSEKAPYSVKVKRSQHR